MRQTSDLKVPFFCTIEGSIVNSNATYAACFAFCAEHIVIFLSLIYTDLSKAKGGAKSENLSFDQ